MIGRWFGACLGTLLTTAVVALATLGNTGLLAALAISGLTLLMALVAARVISPAQALLVVAVLLPMNKLRPAGVGAVGDLALLVTGLALLPFSDFAVRVKALATVLAGMAIILVTGLIGTVATAHWADLGQVARFFLGGPVVLLIVGLLVKTRRQALFVMAAYTAGVVISAGVAATQSAPNGRVGGLAIAAAALAISSTFGLTFLAGAFFARRGAGIRRLALVPLGLVPLYGVFVAGGRSGLAGLALVALIFALSHRTRGMITFLVSVPSGLVAVVLVAPLLPNGDTILRAVGLGQFASSLAASNGEHAATANRALGVILDHWATGVGFGEANALNAHSMLLTVAATGGLIAVIGLGLVVWPFIRGAAVAVRRGNADPMATFLAGGSLAFVQTALLHPQLWDRYVWFWMALVLVVLADPVPRKRPQPATVETFETIGTGGDQKPGKPPISGAFA